MAGIISYGAYIPLHRMERAVIGKAWGQGAMPGEKAVANYDEDSVTMSVAAGLDCIGDMDRKLIDGVFVATTTSPYQEKQVAAIVAGALDLRTDAITSDFTGSLRGCTLAMKAALDAVKSGPAKRILVIAADTRLGMAQGQKEVAFGDGAGAVLIGEGDEIATILGSATIYNEMLDVWRTADDKFVKMWEDRFILDKGYMTMVGQAAGKVMATCKVGPKDIAKAAIYAPDPRSHQTIIKALGMDPKTQLQDSLFGLIGNTGVAQTLMTLAGALETAKAGDKILVASYGDGADAFIFQVTDKISKVKPVKGISGHLKHKQMIGNYEAYLKMRQLLTLEVSARPPELMPSAVAMWREGKKNSALYGTKCNQCGIPQFPPQRVCVYCQAKDDSTPYRFSDKKAKLVTYTIDSMGMKATDVPPVISSVTDFEPRGRIWCQMTDFDLAKIAIDMPLEMTFRKMYEVDSVPIYFWKTKPAG